MTPVYVFMNIVQLGYIWFVHLLGSALPFTRPVLTIETDLECGHKMLQDDHLLDDLYHRWCLAMGIPFLHPMILFYGMFQGKVGLKTHWEAFLGSLTTDRVQCIQDNYEQVGTLH